MEKMTDLKDYLNSFSGERVLMTIFPHPDDETLAAGGILLLAKSLGWKTVVVCLTKGGAGKMLINPRGKSTKEVREKELERATKLLLVDEVISGDFPDGQLRESKDKWELWLSDIIKKYGPGIVVTYDRSGMTGHPDHIILSVGIGEVISKMKKKPNVLWTAFPGALRNRVIPESLWEYAAVPTVEFNLGRYLIRKWLAAKSHKSQPLKPANLWWVPLLFLFFSHRFEWYHEVDFKKDYPFKFIDFKI